jgi:hypothetical protein
LDGVAIPLREVVKPAISDGHLHGLILPEIWRLESVLLLQGTLLIVVRAGAALPVEEFNIA